MQMNQNVCKNAKSMVRVGKDLGERFSISRGTRQRDHISHQQYSLHYLERVIDKIQGTGTRIVVHGNRINNLMFADNKDLIEGQIKPQRKMWKFSTEKGRLKQNQESLIFRLKKNMTSVEVDGQNIEVVGEFVQPNFFGHMSHICRMDITRLIKAGRE